MNTQKEVYLDEIIKQLKRELCVRAEKLQRVVQFSAAG